MSPEFGDVLAVVIAGVEKTCDGGGGNDRAAAASLGTVLYGVVRPGALLATPQAPHLGDGGRAFVEIAAILGADISPAAARGST